MVLTNINKAIVESLWDRNLTQGTTKNIPWAFFQEQIHPLIETSSRGSYKSQEFDLDNLFYFYGLSSYKKPSKAHLKHPL